MLDALAVVSIALMFALSLIYVSGCDHLKGSRQ